MGDSGEGTKKKLARLEQEVYERGKTIRQREESIDKLKAKVARLKKEREQMENLEREAQRCLKEKVEAEKARTEAEAQLQTITDQLQAFRKGKSEADVIKQQEALLSTLRQELIEAKSRAEKRDALEEECKRKQGENAELKAEIAQLKRELEEKSWNLSVERMRRGDVSDLDENDDATMKRSKSEMEGKEKHKTSLVAESLRQERDELIFLITIFHSVTQPAYDGNTPVPADKALRAFTKWKVFEKGSVRRSFLNNLITAIDSSSTKTDKGMTGYWLSVSVYLFSALRSEFGYSEAKSSKGSALADFASQLQATISNIFERLLMSLYTELATVLSIAVLEQPSSLSSAAKCTLHSTQETLLPILDSYLTIFLENHIPLSLVKQFFTQGFYFINFTLFNTLLNTKRMCTCANGFQIKLELSQLEQWISKTLQIPEIKNQLDIMAQAINVLVMDKNVILEGDTLKQICPLLTAKQIKRLLELFTPDQLSPAAVPQEVFLKLKKASEGDNKPLETPPTRMVNPLAFDF